jgi:glycosyltransferase involved in cell wall biosynthesis
VNITVLHNFYQLPGGEDQVFRGEVDLLKSYGHQVSPFVLSNDHLTKIGPLRQASSSIWNGEVHANLRKHLRQTNADVVHIHNTFPLASPSVYYAAGAEGVPVVQTLHNFRLLCPAANLFRDGRPCESCLHTATPWPAVIHACYRQNRLATAVAAGVLTTHRALGTWETKVDSYIALTDFARVKFVSSGLPAEKIFVKPNFIHPDPGVGTGTGGFALFVGRLSPEKGVETALEAWSSQNIGIPLKVVGDGPLKGIVEAAAQRNQSIEHLGWCSKETVLSLMKAASFLILPSLCYEGFPMTIVEAFAVGLPVIASRIGSLASVIEPNHTGLLFEPGNSDELAKLVADALRSGSLREALSRAARERFLERYTQEANYSILMNIYAAASQIRHNRV